MLYFILLRDSSSQSAQSRLTHTHTHTLTQWTPSVNSWIIPWVRALTVSHQIVGMIFNWSFTLGLSLVLHCTSFCFALFKPLFDLDTVLIKFFCRLIVHGDKEHALPIPAWTSAISLCASHGETNRKKTHITAGKRKLDTGPCSMKLIVHLIPWQR